MGVSFRNLTVIVTFAVTAVSYGSDFDRHVRPFLKNYCADCHGPQKQKAGLRFDRLDPDVVNGTSTDTWQEVLDLLNISEMPPADATQPTSAERTQVVEILTDLLSQAARAKTSTGGRNVIRRMTAYEYNNTLRDLFHLDLNYAADLPPEGAAKEGFRNNSSVLGTSALHLEYFERIARNALERILLAPKEKPVPYFVHVEPERGFASKSDEGADIRKRNKKPGKRARKPAIGYTLAGDDYRPGSKARAGLFRLEHGELSDDGTAVILAGNRAVDKLGDPFAEDRKIGGAQGDGRSGYQPEFRVELYEVPHDTPVLVRIRVSAIPGSNDALPRLSFELGSFRGAGVSDQKEAVNVEVSNTNPETLEFVVHGANFPFQSNKSGRPSYFRIFNEYRRGTSSLTYEELPKLKIDWVEITSNYYESWPSVQKQSILPESNGNQDETELVTAVLQRFMTRAYRRPATAAEVSHKLQLFARLRPQEESFEGALVSTLTAVLCSPNFLLLAEPGVEVSDEETVPERRKLNGYELASRLSYFLWSSMPDETLFRLAESGELQQPSVLLEQVRRMIRDPKSEAFSRNFATQWLDLPGVRRLAVNPEYFNFREKMKDLFEEEPVQFVHHVMTSNLSIQQFIDSDFAMLNPALARHYRIRGISGGGFQPHAVQPSDHRGGLMTQAGMLFGCSTGAETHPIKRGVWVLERMLDDPPPPPPPNVPDLPEPEAVDESNLSLKERLVAHANVESCRDCHSKIDPWGVAFENYNALGQWREGDKDPLVLNAHQKVAIDPSTQLRNGHQINGLDDLKKYILNDKENQFRRAVVRKVLSYSLGRYLEFADRPAVDSICEKLQREGDQFQVLMEQITLSEPFLTK